MFGIKIVRQKSSATPKKSTPRSKGPKPLVHDDKPVAFGQGMRLMKAAAASQIDTGTVVPGTDVTLAQLRHRVASMVRPNGTVGPHYPAIFALTNGQAAEAIEYLEGLPSSPRPYTGPKPVASVPDSQPAVEAELALLKAQMANLLDALGVKAEAPAEPAEPVVPTVTIDGEVFQVVTWKDGSKHLKAV